MSNNPEQQQLAKQVAAPPTPGGRFQNVVISGNSQAILGDTYHIHEAAQRTPEQAALEERLQALQYPGMLDRFQSLCDPYPETFKWIMKSTTEDDLEESSDASGVHEYETPWDSFTDWLKDGSDPYWIMGKLGTGKSVLMKYIVECLSDDQFISDGERNKIVVSHFFWEPGAELQRSVTGCLRSLLWQLLPYQTKSTSSQARKTQNVHSVQRLCRDLISCLECIDNEVLIFLDGLDECRETDEVLDVVDALRALRNVRLCISSRPDEAFNLNFSDFPKLRLQDLNKTDIERVVRTELLENNRVQRSKGWDPKNADELAMTITFRAEGVFLWVRLVVKELLRGFTGRDTLQQMHERLERLPNDVYTLYTALIRRNDQDSQDYTSQAAFYCQLIKTHRDQAMPLLAFYFATHDQIREQFLDTTTIFDQQLAYFDDKIDCELLITWINVRTAGLLEVSRSSRYGHVYSGESRPWLSAFRDHQVGFVHRSAYTYLESTTEGQVFMRKCLRSHAEISTLSFESLLVFLCVIPGLCRTTILSYCVPILSLPLLSTITTHMLTEALKVLCSVFDDLYFKDLILTTDAWEVSNGVAFPKSKHRNVDLCPIFASHGQTKFVRTLLQQDDRQHDHEYMSRMLLHLIDHKLQADLRVDKGEIAELLQSLSTYATALNTVISTNSKEEVHLMCGLASSAYNASILNRPELSALVSQFILQYKTGPDFCLMPLSRDLAFRFRIHNAHYLDDLSIYFSVSVETLQAWDMIHDHDLHPYRGCVFAFSEGGTLSPYRQRIMTIDPSDSDEVLEILIRARKQTLNVYTSLSHGSGCASVRGREDPEMWQMLQPIVRRSRYVDSFIDCLRHIGKSEETIEYFVKEEVALKTYDRLRTFKECKKHFNWLLGRDNVASWCQKTPELQALLHSYRQGEDDVEDDAGDDVEGK